MQYELWCRKLPGNFQLVEIFYNQNQSHGLVGKHYEEYDEFIVLMRYKEDIMPNCCLCIEKPRKEKTLVRR